MMRSVRTPILVHISKVRWKKNFGINGEVSMQTQTQREGEKLELSIGEDDPKSSLPK